MHTVNTPHILENTVRDMYEKKFGFTYRPPVNNKQGYDYNNSKMPNRMANYEDSIGKDLNESRNISAGFNRSFYKFNPDQVEYYMFSSSIDHKELASQCPLGKDHIRTQVYLTLQKFELVNVESPTDIDQDKYQVKMVGFLQCDPKLSKLKYGIYRTALPNFTREFYTSLVAYLEKTKNK